MMPLPDMMPKPLKRDPAICPKCGNRRELQRSCLPWTRAFIGYWCAKCHTLTPQP